MECLITDTVYPGIAEELKRFIDVKTSDRKSPSRERVIRGIAGADVFIIRVDPKISRDVLNAAKNLKAVGVCVVGLNHVDLEYTEEKDIQIFNAPGLNTNAVTELTISKMLDIPRHTIPASQDVKVNHIWGKYKYVGRELCSETLGVTGFGRISRRIAEFTKAFGMTIVAYDPFLKPEDFECEGVKGVGTDELIKTSDFISLHIPLTPETKDLFDKKSITEMKDDTVVLNMGRGGIIGEQDMYETFCADKIGGYTADVTENEFAGSGLSSNDEFRSPPFSCDNFAVSLHTGVQTVGASRDIGLHIIEKVKEVMNLK